MKELFNLSDFQLEQESDTRIAKELSGIHDKLSEYRYVHSLEVAMVSLQLWKHFFSNNIPLRNQILHAALLHDITKELKTKEHLQIAQRHNMQFELERLPSSLHHSFTGALIAQEDFGHADKNIVWAIRYHTTGACCMPLSAQIVYIADYLASTKISWKNQQEKKLSQFNELVLLKTQHTIEKLVKKRLPVATDTYELYQSLTEKT